MRINDKTFTLLLRRESPWKIYNVPIPKSGHRSPGVVRKVTQRVHKMNAKWRAQANTRVQV